MGDHEEVDFGRSRYQVGYFPKLLPSLTAEWLEHVSPIPGVIGSNPEVSGVITEKVILAAGFIQSTLWRGFAKCFESTVV